jgi:hypothetical protein
MSDENTTQDSSPEVNHDEELTTSIKQGKFTDGLYTGFTFVYPEFGSTSAAVEKYGEDVIARLINTAIASAVRTKVKNGLAKFSDEKSAGAIEAVESLKAKHPDGVIFGEAELSDWRPYDREYSDAKLQKMLTAAVAKGDKPEAIRLRDMLLKRINALEI